MTSDVRGTYRFARIPEWVLLCPELDAIDIRVFAVLDRFDGRDCFPSLARVAERIKCSEQTVRRAIRRLQVVGAVAVEKRIVDGRQSSNRYILAGDRALPRVTARPITGDTPGPITGATLPLSRMEGDPEQEDPEQEDPKTSAHRSDERGRFEEFWKVYPRRVGKRAAIKAWDTAVTRGTSAAILSGLGDRVAWWKRSRTPADKIPHPATWLARDGWLDELEPDIVAPAASTTQASKDRVERQRDELERAIMDGNAEHAWQLMRDRARGRHERWFDDIARGLDEGLPNSALLLGERDGRRLTAADVAQVRTTKLELWQQCGLLSPAIAELANPHEGAS